MNATGVRGEVIRRGKESLRGRNRLEELERLEVEKEKKKRREGVVSPPYGGMRRRVEVGCGSGESIVVVSSEAER